MHFLFVSHGLWVPFGPEVVVKRKLSLVEGMGEIFFRFHMNVYQQT